MGRDGRLRSARGRNAAASIAAGGNSAFSFAAECRRERRLASQRFSQRQGGSLCESTGPVGTGYVTDKNLLPIHRPWRHQRDLMPIRPLNPKPAIPS